MATYLVFNVSLVVMVYGLFRFIFPFMHGLILVLIRVMDTVLILYFVCFMKVLIIDMEKCSLGISRSV